MTFYSVAFHSLMYFLVWSKNHFYRKNTFACTLLPKCIIFPVAIFEGQDACAVACAVFCCCRMFLLLSTRTWGFGCGTAFCIPRDAGGEPMLRVPVGWGALPVFTRTHHSPSSCKYKSDLTCYHPAGEYHQSR